MNDTAGERAERREHYIDVQRVLGTAHDLRQRGWSDVEILSGVETMLNVRKVFGSRQQDLVGELQDRMRWRDKEGKPLPLIAPPVPTIECQRCVGYVHDYSRGGGRCDGCLGYGRIPKYPHIARDPLSPTTCITAREGYWRSSHSDNAADDSAQLVPFGCVLWWTAKPTSGSRWTVWQFGEDEQQAWEQRERERAPDPAKNGAAPKSKRKRGKRK